MKTDGVKFFQVYEINKEQKDWIDKRRRTTMFVAIPMVIVIPFIVESAILEPYVAAEKVTGLVAYLNFLDVGFLMYAFTMYNFVQKFTTAVTYDVEQNHFIIK